MPDAYGIYYIDANSWPPAINLFEAANRRSHHLADLRGDVQDWGAGPRVSGDGRTLVYAETDQVAGDIMLVEGFR